MQGQRYTLRLPRRRVASPGFTLVEIMVVVMIIGVLFAMAIASFTASRHHARINRARADLRIIGDAVASLAFDTGQWPGGIPAYENRANAEVWNLNSPAAGIVASDGRFSGWSEPYMRRVPIDPWGTAYFFDADYNADGLTIAVVGSLGADRGGTNWHGVDNIYVRLR